MSEDGNQHPERPAGQAPPQYPAAPPPATGDDPALGYVPGQPFPPPGQGGWPQQPPPPPMAVHPVYVRPDLPKATAAMVVGIVAVAGGFMLCGVPLLIAPVAWVLGAQARRQIREAPQQWDGEGKATAGLVLGIIGTVLLVLALILLIVIVVIAINDPTAFDDGSNV